MSLMLPSVTAATPPGKPADSTAAQHNAQEPEAPETFGEVLSRALTPAGEAAGKPGTKTTAPTAAKRQPADDKTDPPALLNAAALALVPPAQDQVLPTAPARAGLAVAANTSAARTAGAPPTEPPTAAATELPALAAEPAPSGPGTQAPDAGTSDPSSQADDRAPRPPVLTLGAAKLAAPAVASADAAPADAAAAMPVSASQ
ncbi:MAG: hypothetical protein M0P52_12690, partial [Rhodoferax sp.]|nr:hypothetical protein [Rhodoferax sp.]